MRHGRAAVLGLVPFALAAMTGSGRADLLRVDMQPNAPFAGRPPVNFTGVESQAAAASPLFGSNGSNTWNYLTAPPSGSGTVTNPVFSNLVDSAGAATGVSLSFTGTFDAADDTPIDNSGSNAVENDYFLIGGTTVIGYTISGLAANTREALYLYAPNFVHYDSGYPDNQPSRGYTLTANGETITVPSGPDNNALAYVTTDASGDISGTWSSPLLNEGDWSGFQLATVPTAAPEPASLPLLVGGLVALAAVARRRTRH